MIKIGVTGTDTGVGKTVVAIDLITKLRAQGQRVAPMKPVETGISHPADLASDAMLLKQAAGSTRPIELIRPYLFHDPVAPLVAARLAQQSIDMTILDHAFTQLSESADAIVVEGAGGLLVPFTETENFATIAKLWKLELVIVAANKLGVINHTLLTVNTARVYGIPIRTVVLNTIPGTPPDTAMQTNFATLRELLGDVPVSEFPC